ncbi:MAG: serine hydrolase domain-containing protein [Polyangia bacterium]
MSNTTPSGRIDAVLEEAVDSRRIVGAAIVVLRAGEPVYRRALGWADREADVPMSASHVFRLASVTKPIVTLAALRLVDMGRLRLDEPVTTYLPDFRPRFAGGDSPVITIAHLLTHTAGLSYQHFERPDGPYHRAGVSDGLDEPGLAMEEELRRIVRAGLAFAPGTQWAYSVALDVVGAVIERVLSQPLPTAVRELVTEPLLMVDTGFSAPAAARLVTPYADGSPPRRMRDPDVVPFMGMAGIRFSPRRVFDPRSFPSGGAGMNGTADDIARLLEVVRTGPKGLLTPGTARAMMTNQVGDLPVVLGPGWGFGFGGAVLVDPRAAATPQPPGTWSWGGAWGHSWFVDPASELVVVALTNTAVEGLSGRFPTDLRDAVYGRRPTSSWRIM